MKTRILSYNKAVTKFEEALLALIQPLASRIAPMYQSGNRVTELTIGGLGEPQTLEGLRHRRLDVTFKRGFEFACPATSLSVRFTVHDDPLKPDRRRVGIEPSLNWAGGGGTPAEAVAKAALYREVAELACLITTYNDFVLVPDDEDAP